jgi:hypothetical protein
VKLLLQLATVFKPEGLQNREGTVVYKDGLHDCKVPVLAIAGDEDLICPPIAVTGQIPALHPRITLLHRHKCTSLWLILVSIEICLQSTEILVKHLFNSISLQRFSIY